MENKITDLHSLQLEKQRLKMLCSHQEKEIAENFKLAKHKLTPAYIIKEAIVEIIPKDIRNNYIVSLIINFMNKKNDGGIALELLNLVKPAIMPLLSMLIDKFKKNKATE